MAKGASVYSQYRECLLTVSLQGLHLPFVCTIFCLRAYAGIAYLGPKRIPAERTVEKHILVSYEILYIYHDQRYSIVDRDPSVRQAPAESKENEFLFENKIEPYAWPPPDFPDDLAGVDVLKAVCEDYLYSIIFAPADGESPDPLLVSFAGDNGIIHSYLAAP